MKKEKILLCLSFIPLIALLIIYICLKYDNTGELSDKLLYYFLKINSDYNIIFKVALLCFIYQLYYLIVYIPKLGKCLYNISIVIWVLFFLSGIYYFVNGDSGCIYMNCYDNTGLAALGSGMLNTLIQLCFIPVLPASLAIIVIYKIVNSPNKKTLNKN